MVFKVKKRARYNYFEVTPTNSDDEQFNLAFSLGKDKKLKYSFNWPYDFFSLVELAQIQTENTFVSEEDQAANTTTLPEDGSPRPRRLNEIGDDDN